MRDAYHAAKAYETTDKRETPLTVAQEWAVKRALESARDKQYEFAIEAYEDALKHPGHPRTAAQLWHEIGVCAGHLGDAQRSAGAYERSLTLNPNHVASHQALIMSLDFRADTTMGRASLERALWWSRWGAGLWRGHEEGPASGRVDWRGAGFTNAPDPERPLRVGFVGGDFRLHSSAYIHAAMCVGPAPAACGIEVYCYANQATFQPIALVTPPSGMKRGWAGERIVDGGDESESRLSAYANDDYLRMTTFRIITDLDDRTVCSLIRQDRIDVLVDLSGHSEGNRLGVFARRAAPIQVTGIGYATGTGCPSIDWFLADAVTVKPDEEKYYAERIWRAPVLVGYCPPYYLRRDPEDDLEEHVKDGMNAELPTMELRPAGAPFTFGVSSRIIKISEESIAAWRTILEQTKDTRLIIRDRMLEVPDVLARFRRAFAGLDDRVELRGGSDHVAYMAGYREIDVSLDPYPHTGGVSSLESLWMGVPVITRTGQLPVSRLTATMLQHLDFGLRRLTTSSASSYVRMASAMPHDRDWLAEVRAGLRPAFKKSILWGDTWAAAVYGEMRDKWREWCRQAV